MIRIRSRATRRAAIAGATAAALLGGVAACGDDGPAGTADDPIELTFAYWGAEDRIELTQQVIELYEEQNEGITIQANTNEFPDHWSALTPQMSSGDLPDIVNMDYSRLREFAEAGLLTDLTDYVDTGNFREGFLETGYIDDELLAVPIAGNTLGLVYRNDYYDTAGVEYPTDGGTWAEFNADLVSLTEGLGEGIWGSGDYGGQYHFMELWLRQQGGSFYTEDGSALNFDEATMIEWWSMTESLRDGSGIIPVAVGAEAEEDPFIEGTAAAGIGWDNFLNWFGAPVAEQGGELSLAVPPSDDPDNLGLYLKPAMQLTIAANSEYPEEAGDFIDFFLNDPEAAAILGTNRGIPASQTALDAIVLDDISQKIFDYEESVSPYLTTPPPAPPAATGEIEVKMGEIYERLLYEEVTVEEAVDQFFAEAENFLG